MASVNRVIVLGNLGQDPEVRYLPNGDAVCNISIATSRTWKDKNGDKQEETEWHRISFFGRMAEIAGEYLAKGKPVYVEGRLRTRKYTDKDGIDRYATEIVAENMQLLGGREDGQERGQRPASRAPAPAEEGRYASQRTPAAQRPAGAAAKAQPAMTGSGFDDMDDDIPF